MENKNIYTNNQFKQKYGYTNSQFDIILNCSCIGDIVEDVPSPKGNVSFKRLNENKIEVIK